MSLQHRNDSSVSNHPPPPSGGGGWIFDIITTVFLMASVAILSATILIINDPAVSFNPFPLDPIPTRFQTATPTITLTPTITATPTQTPVPPTPTPTSTATITPSPTVTPSVSPTPLLPNLEPPTPDSAVDAGVPLSPPGTEPPFPFMARPVRYESNTNDQGCQWLSIAGNVTGLSGEPLTDLAVEFVGNNFEYTVFSGTNQLFGFSGFEVPIGSAPARREFAVRLIGPLGVPVSDFVTVITGETCDRNVAIVEFVQLVDY